MRFWPFGKEENEAGEVEFASRVVTGSARDGAQLRAKLSVSFSGAMTQTQADEVADMAAGTLREIFVASDDAAAILERQENLGADVVASSRSIQGVLRSVDVVALHVVDEAEGTVKRPSNRPAEEAGARASSRPPPAAARRAASSSQLLAVRDSRLIPEGASAETAAAAIVPLLRDAGTRVLVGILRAYDLLIVRGLDTTSTDEFGELVPVSVAAPGRFAFERRPELSRWHDKLGEDAIAALRGESSAVVCFFLHVSLQRAGVEVSASTALLEAAARIAFAQDTPLAALPFYLGVAGEPTDALAAHALAILGGPSDLIGSFSRVLTPVLGSLQEDFAFTSSQIKMSLAP